MSKAINVLDLKHAKEDFEFYPTSREVLTVFHKEVTKKIHRFDKHRSISLLDVGAGDGKVFKVLDEISSDKEKGKIYFTKKYAVEKSRLLIEQMPKDVFIVGSDFYRQTFIDKKVDVVYSNPPYSDFENWSIKLIKESNCSELYLLIPTRWSDSREIKEAIDFRSATSEVVYEYDFINSEDRKARATVNLVKIMFNRGNGSYHCDDSNPFSMWMKDAFNFESLVEEKSKYVNREEKIKEINNSLVSGKDLASVLVELYDNEMLNTIENYKKVASLDADILDELEINIDNFIEKAELKIAGVKSIYWKELFKNLNKITNRLTAKSRELMLQDLNENTSIDFTVSNIQAVLIWVLKNGNSYFDSQLLDVYKTLTQEDNIRLYKSNHRMVKDGWRFHSCDELQTKYFLEYRMVCHKFGGISSDDYFKRGKNNLSERAYTFIADFIVIARNLGFLIEDSLNDILWESGKKNYLYFVRKAGALRIGDKTNIGKIQEVYKEQYKINNEWFHYSVVYGESQQFVEIKAHKNGNIHLKFNQSFMRALNIEVSRLTGWVKSPKEASEEIGIDIEDVKEFWHNNFYVSDSMGFLQISR